MLNQISDRVRQPEYTGQNRCLPCTLTNSIIAIAAAGILATVSFPLSGGVLITSAVFIYYRGYLIPGTPTLTKRYFPDRVLGAFNKNPANHLSETAGEQSNSKSVFSEIGIIRYYENKSGMDLSRDFRKAWNREIDTMTESQEHERLKHLLNVDNIEIKTNENNCVVYANSSPMMLRESRPALTADLAAIPVFRDRYQNWENENLSAKNEYLSSLRLFLNQCPACGSSVTFTNDLVKSCCGSTKLMTALCEECDTRLAEFER